MLSSYLSLFSHSTCPLHMWKCFTAVSSFIPLGLGTENQAPKEQQDWPRPSEFSQRDRSIHLSVKHIDSLNSNMKTGQRLGLCPCHTFWEHQTILQLLPQQKKTTLIKTNQHYLTPTIGNICFPLKNTLLPGTYNMKHLWLFTSGWQANRIGDTHW